MTAAGPELPVLFDGVVRLRPFAAEDAATLATIWRDPSIRARNNVPEPARRAAAEWVASSAANAALGDAWEWAIVDAATDRLAGRLTSYFISNFGVPVDAAVFGLNPDNLSPSPAVG